MLNTKRLLLLALLLLVPMGAQASPTVVTVDVPLAIKELKLTTTGYINTKWKTPPVGTHWYNAMKALGQLAPPNPNLVFRDDFNAPVAQGAFPTTNWTVYPAGWPDTFGYGIRWPAILSVHDGYLDMPEYWDSAHYLTNAVLPKLPTTLYGRFEMRLKATPAVGFKTAFLLWPDSETWPRDGEIDFPEGNLNGTMCAFMHRQDAIQGSDQDAFCPPTTYTDWHTIAIDWRANSCSFYIDGQLIGQATNRVPNTPMHWVLQTETTPDNLPVKDTSIRGHVLIDWVAVYK